MFVASFGFTLRKQSKLTADALVRSGFKTHALQRETKHRMINGKSALIDIHLPVSDLRGNGALQHLKNDDILAKTITSKNMSFINALCVVQRVFQLKRLLIATTCVFILLALLRHRRRYCSTMCRRCTARYGTRPCLKTSCTSSAVCSATSSRQDWSPVGRYWPDLTWTRCSRFTAKKCCTSTFNAPLLVTKR